MAFRETTVEEIEFLANSFKEISDKLFSVTEKMKNEKLLKLVLQIDAVQTHYLPPCERMAADIDMHFRDQLRCLTTKGVPQWQRSVQKAAYNKALRESKTSVEPENLVKPAKKATKKKGA